MVHVDEARCEDEVAVVARMHAHHVQGSTADRAAVIVKDHWQFKVLVMHLISLMHGVALARLRRDFKISNLEVCMLQFRSQFAKKAVPIGVV